MDLIWKTFLWEQNGAAIDMVENAILACPDDLWGDRSQRPEFWYVAFHTLFFLDLFMSGSEVGFIPPEPFTLDELDERGIMPERVYSKEELLKYLKHDREKCRATLALMTDERANQPCNFSWIDMVVAESLLYNLRHVQHHAGQLNLMLKRKIDAAPRWVRKTNVMLQAQ